MTLGETPSQTIGPFFAIVGRHGLLWADGPHVVAEDEPGGFWISGRLLDADGDPVDDGVVETWQADPDGRFAHPDDPRGQVDSAFRGFGRCPTDSDGSFRIHTCKPGRVPSADGLQAPHLDVAVHARGVLHHLVTRIYFADEAAANAEDPVLARLDEAARDTLMAEPTGDGYRFDIRLRGDGETVFFAV
jgi:protocatechuate 3,4-dioxygenase, alpha subunit